MKNIILIDYSNITVDSIFEHVYIICETTDILTGSFVYMKIESSRKTPADTLSKPISGNTRAVFLTFKKIELINNNNTLCGLSLASQEVIDEYKAKHPENII